MKFNEQEYSLLEKAVSHYFHYCHNESLHGVGDINRGQHEWLSKRCKEMLDKLESRWYARKFDLIEIHKLAKQYYDSEASWKMKYDAIFSDEISKQVPFDWYDPDTGYQEDVVSFMSAFDNYMEDFKKLHNVEGEEGSEASQHECKHERTAPTRTFGPMYCLDCNKEL